MSIIQLAVLTLAYLEAGAGEVLGHKRNLEENLRQAGNAPEQI